MLLKSARFALALVLSLSLCPMAAYAVEDEGADGSYGVGAQADDVITVYLNGELYEEALAKPVDSFASDYAGPLSSSSILKGWGEYLYYLRETPVAAGSSNFAFRTFERYGVETGEWETLPSLPEWLTYATGCIWDGNFLVAGVVYDASTGTATTQERIYMYNFELQDWVLLDSEGVPLGAGIVNLNGFLRLVGGANSSWVFSNDVYEYDTGSGIGGRVASLATPVFCPQLTVYEGQIFVYSYGDSLAQYNGSGVTRHFQVVVDEDAVQIDSALPAIAPVGVPAGMPARAEAFGSIAAGIDYLFLVGPTSADGSTDTYILDLEDWEDSTFNGLSQRASNARMYGASACIHDDVLYAAAASEVEASHSVFRGTRNEVVPPAVKNGSMDSVWRQGSDEPLTFVFTPDYSRFYDLGGGVFVDGVELYFDEYTASSGSTVIDLLPEFLSKLALGEHELLVYFDGYEDGPGAEVAVTFTIVSSDSPTPKPTPTPVNPPLTPGGTASGYARPAALAMTGDMLLVVPFAVIGIGAVALGVYLVRRKMRNN